MRANLESAAARFAAENAPPGEVASLKHVCELFSKYQGDVAAKTEHENIFAAIEMRKADKAEQAARTHIENARNARLQILFVI